MFSTKLSLPQLTSSCLVLVWVHGQHFNMVPIDSQDALTGHLAFPPNKYTSEISILGKLSQLYLAFGQLFDDNDNPVG